MRRNPKPIRKCHGCELNFRDHCAYYPYPFQMWLAGACPGYNNRQLIDQVKLRAQPPLTPHDRRRLLAQARARQRRRLGPRQRGRYGGAIGR